VPAYDRSGLGKKIPYSDLPDDCRRLVERDCADEESAYA
jgi:hypothetical protein